MAFAQLFSSLSDADEDVRSARQPAVTLRSDTDGGGRGRKRKTPCELIGSCRKKPCFQVQQTPTSNNLKDNNTKAKGRHTQDTDGERGLHGFSSRERKSQRQQQLKKKLDGQKDRNQDKDRGRTASRNGRPTTRRGGRGGQHNGDRQDFEMKPRIMTQEFRDQNALVVDGRLLCRHFLWGRCIKADECQLEHIQGYNDLIKEVCKFYVQGFCAKESFPCKFFHRKGKCSQREDCRFSHEPLNDVTEKLLDEALKRESDLYELARKAEQESPVQLANKEEPEVMETNGTPDVLEGPVRPNFYNSTEASTETETSNDAPQCASGTAQPHSPSSTSNSHPEPVCYSVEAVLGPQLYRPFPSFYNSPKSKESTSLTAPETTFKATSGSTAQNKVPYSVDAVLRSFKSVENSAFGQRPTPPSVKTKEIPDPVSRPQYQREKVSLRSREEPNKSQDKMYKSLSSLQAHTSLISSPDLSLSSGNQKQCGDMPESLKSAPTAFQKVKLACMHPPVNVENFLSSKSKADMKESTELPADNTCPHKHPTQLKPKPSLGVTEVKSRTAAPVEPAANSIKTSDAANFAVHHFAAKQLAEIPQYPRKTQSVLKPGAQKPRSTKMSPQCSSETATRGHFTKTQKIPFNRLFANPVTESVTPAADSVRTTQAADFTSKERPVKTSTASFLSLFATPLSEPLSTPSCSQVSAENTFHLATERVSNLVLTPSYQVQTDVKQTSHSPTSLKCSTTSKTEPGPAALPRGQVELCTMLGVGPASSIVHDSLKETPSGPAPRDLSPSKTPALEHLPDGSSPRGASKNSVLKSLFLNLRPYHEDGEQQDCIQISARPGSGTNNKGSVFGKQQHDQKNHRTSSSQSAVKAATHSEEQPSSQKSSEVTGGPAPGSPGVTEPQVRNSDTHDFPPESVISPDPQPRVTHTSGVGKRGHGNVAVTPLKDLFKTLHRAAFQPGH